MRFEVPQFIESETKIAGPLTFRQLLYLMVAGGIVIFFYYTLAQANFALFIILAIISLLVGSAFAFLKISGYSFSVFLKNFLGFFVGSKVYLWERKIPSVKLIEKKEQEKKEKKEPKTLKIAEKSQLNKISAEIEMNSK